MCGARWYKQATHKRKRDEVRGRKMEQLGRRIGECEGKRAGEGEGTEEGKDDREARSRRNDDKETTGTAKRSKILKT